jgi:excisionase family DNA binding protein
MTFTLTDEQFKEVTRMQLRANPPAVMTVEDLALIFDCSTDKVYADAAEGKIPGKKVGSLWRFERETILTWLRNDKSKGGLKK